MDINGIIMDKSNYIERLKDELHASDYKAIKHSEGLISEEDYQPIKEERQLIRAEINKVEVMTEEEYYDAYPEEMLPEEVINEPENEEDFGYDGI